MEPKEAYIKAGKMAAEVLARGIKYIEEEAFILEICEKVEDDIRKLGGEPAFPCNVSQNEEAAHYTASPNDRKVVKKGSIVKLDIGVHIDGYIADTAMTVGFSSTWDRMIDAAKWTLEHALKAIEPGMGFSTFGKVVEEKASSLGFKTIENLAGHKLGKYTVHAGESVPNRSRPSVGIFKVGEAYAIEPFLVDRRAKAYVINKGHSNIYRLSNPKRAKDKGLRNLVMDIWNSYKGLPFASRWVYAKFGESGLSKLKRLEELGVVHGYPILVEASGAPVVQFEHTVLVDRESILITTIKK